MKNEIHTNNKLRCLNLYVSEKQQQPTIYKVHL